MTTITRIAVLAALLGGCNLYWGGGAAGGGGGGDDVCIADSASPPYEELRNPQTGQCESFGLGTDCGGCIPCPDHPGSGWQPLWASCSGACDALTETQCLANADCHAAYFDDETSGCGECVTLQLMGCWNLSAAGPNEDGVCANLDAQTCSERGSCKSYYFTSTLTNATTFMSCAETRTLCSDDGGCGPGQHCDTAACHQKPCPDPATPQVTGCNTTCYGVCTP